MSRSLWSLRNRRAEGMTIIEVMIASALLLLVVAAVFSVMSSAMRVQGNSRQRSTGVFWSNHLMELAKNKNFYSLGYNASDSTNASLNGYVAAASTDSPSPDASLANVGGIWKYRGERLVRNGECDPPDAASCDSSRTTIGNVSHNGDSGQLGTERQIYRGWTFVTWAPQSVPATSGASRTVYEKRVTVVVRYKPLVNGASGTIVSSSLFNIGYVPVPIGNGQTPTGPSISSCVSAADAVQPAPTTYVADFTASATYGSDPVITSYDWDWDGNGTVDSTSTSPARSNTYATQSAARAIPAKVRAIDGAGLVSAWAQCSGTIPGYTAPTTTTLPANCTSYPTDSTAPTVTSFTVSQNAVYATSQTVTLNMTVTDSQSGMNTMSFSNISATTGFSAAVNYGATNPVSASWSLGAGDGLRTVWARFTDCNGNTTTGPILDTITLDTAAPTVPGAVTATASSPCKITVGWGPATDATSGLKGYNVYRSELQNVNVLQASRGPSVSSFIDPGLTRGVGYTYRVTAVDVAGNEVSLSSANSATDTPKNNNGC